MELICLWFKLNHCRKNLTSWKIFYRNQFLAIKGTLFYVLQRYYFYEFLVAETPNFLDPCTEYPSNHYGRRLLWNPPYIVPPNTASRFPKYANEFTRIIRSNIATPRMASWRTRRIEIKCSSQFFAMAFLQLSYALVVKLHWWVRIIKLINSDTFKMFGLNHWF